VHSSQPRYIMAVTCLRPATSEAFTSMLKSCLTSFVFSSQSRFLRAALFAPRRISKLLAPSVGSRSRPSITFAQSQIHGKFATMLETHSLDSLSQKLLPSTRLAQPPHHSTFPKLTGAIADLSLHPTIETVLHMLNSDLPSAHFLVRRMQAPPAVEGMLLHGILHRAEGDFDNSRAWISDVQDACEGYQPKKKSEGQKLDSDVFSKTKGGKDQESSRIRVRHFRPQQTHR
jgi:hypothetical protein